MHLVVLEDNFLEREFIVEELERAFPEATITQFKNVSDVLMALGTLSTADAIITEHILPLMKARPDFDAWFERLHSQFPDVVSQWDGQKVGERLVRYMRKTGVDTPVIIYTHSDESFVDVDVIRDPRVAYCMKKAARMHNLSDCIRAFLTVAAESPLSKSHRVVRSLGGE